MKRVHRPALLNVAALGLLAGLWIGTANLPAVAACVLLPAVAAGAWLLRRRLPGRDRAWPVTTTTLCLAIAAGIGLMKHAHSPRLLPPLQARLLAARKHGAVCLQGVVTGTPSIRSASTVRIRVRLDQWRFEGREWHAADHEQV